jgi:AraC family transcriptional regulator
VTPSNPFNPPGHALGGLNAVMGGFHGQRSGRDRYYHHAVNFEGPLSLKIVLRGQGSWHVNGRDYVVDAGYCLPLNHGQIYSLTFDLDEPVETFCPFFANGFAESVAAGMTASDVALLDAPDLTAGALEFPVHLRRLDEALRAPVGQLRRLSTETGPCPIAWDEAFADLAAAMIAARDGWRTEYGRGAVRASTAAELTRRLGRARDYIHAHAHNRLTLAQIAEAAPLSPHHLHRRFHAAFGVTPSRYVTGLRLERAQRRLADSDVSVTEVCLAVGFESVGSFATRFRREFGYSPAACRKIARSEKPNADGWARISP